MGNLSNKCIYDNIDLTLINQPIIHKDSPGYKLASTKLDYIMKNGLNKGKFKKPNDLLIIIISNYKELTLAEKSLIYHGIEYVKLDGKLSGDLGKPFIYTNKLKWIVDYIEKNQPKEKYLLYFDARDAIIQDNPNIILNLFQTKKCKLLFSGTEFNGDFLKKKLGVYNQKVIEILKNIIIII